MSREAMKQALEALENVYLGARDEAHYEAITALRQALANEALDRMAENARELGLDYEPAGGTQVSKVWWDGDKLIAKPIPLSEVYKEPEQQPADEPVAWKETDEIKCPICKEKAHPYPKCGHIQPVENRFVRELREYAKRFPAAYLFPNWDVQRALKYLDGYLRPQPAAQWVGLTLEDQKILADSASANNWNDWQMMDAIEQALKEKNHG